MILASSVVKIKKSSRTNVFPNVAYSKSWKKENVSARMATSSSGTFASSGATKMKSGKMESVYARMNTSKLMVLASLVHQIHGPLLTVRGAFVRKTLTGIQKDGDVMRSNVPPTPQLSTRIIFISANATKDIFGTKENAIRIVEKIKSLKTESVSVKTVTLNSAIFANSDAASMKYGKMENAFAKLSTLKSMVSADHVLPTHGPHPTANSAFVKKIITGIPKQDNVMKLCVLHTQPSSTKTISTHANATKDMNGKKENVNPLVGRMRFGRTGNVFVGKIMYIGIINAPLVLRTLGFLLTARFASAKRTITGIHTKTLVII